MNSPAASSSVPNLPLRKGMAITSLVLGILGLPTLGLLLIGGLAGLGLGIAALVKANRSPTVYGGKGLAIAGIVTNGLALLIMPFIVGIIAAIAIPSLLRARVSANEAASIGDIQTVISGETAYATANVGFYDTLDCLVAPDGCIPGYSGPTFLDASLATGAPRHGYTATFHPGPAAENRPATVSPSSLQSFAYVLVPVTPGQTGVRGFCGDSSGQVCYTSDGSAPAVTLGVCAPSCTPLR